MKRFKRLTARRASRAGNILPHHLTWHGKPGQALDSETAGQLEQPPGMLLAFGLEMQQEKEDPD